MAENNFLDQLAGTKATDSNFLDSIAGTIPDSSDAKKPAKPGLWQRVKTQGSEAWKDLVNKEGVNPFEGALRVAGHVGEAAGDVLMAGAGKLYDLTTSDLTKETVKDIGKTIADTDIAKGAVEVAKDVGGLYGKLPERVRNDLGAAFSAINLIPAWQAGKFVVPAARKGSEAIIGLANLAKGQTIRSEVEYGFKKGIKPTVVGKSTAAQTEKFYDNATTAAKDIISASPEAIPQTVEEMFQQVRNVKKTLWDNSSTMARQAGEEGVLVDVFPVISDMRTAAKDPNLIRANPGASSRLNAMADAWESQPLKISPPEAEDLIAQLNAQTKGFWKNPDWNKANDALFAERAANLTRSQTDAAVEAYQGPGWQDFRNRYGAQSAIEKEVSHRANVHARANVRGFFDLSDVFTTGEFVSAIATMNPASLARAAAMYSAKKYIKSQNNVDNIVRKMFRNVKGIMEKNGGITPLQTMSGEPLRFKSSGKHQPIPIPGAATPRPGPGVATELVIGPEGIIRDVPIRPASDYASRFRPGSGEVPPIPGAADVTPVTGIPTETFWKGGLLEERPIIPKDRFYWEGGQLKERPIPAPSGGMPPYSPIPGPGLKNYKSSPSGASGGMPGGNPPPTGPLNPAIMPGGNPPPRPADRGPVQDAVYDNSGLSLPNGQLMLPEPQRMLPSPSGAASSTVGLRKLADKLTAELEGGTPPESLPGGLANYPKSPPPKPAPVAPAPVVPVAAAPPSVIAPEPPPAPVPGSPVVPLPPAPAPAGMVVKQPGATPGGKQPWEGIVYRGKGTSPADAGDLGIGEYHTTSEASAKQYGEVSQGKVVLQNPLRLTADEAGKLAGDYGTLQGTSEVRKTASTKLTNDLQAKGYDGIVVDGYDTAGTTVVKFPSPLPEVGAKLPGVGLASKKVTKKGPENLVTFLEKEGGVDWSGDYNTRYMRQSKDGARTSNMKSRLKPDEAALLANEEGFISPDGKPWDGEKLHDAIESGQGRNILHPEKANAKINREIERDYNDYWDEQAANFESENNLDPGTLEQSYKDIIARVTATPGEQGFSIPDPAAAAKELDNFFTSKKLLNTSKTSDLEGMSAAETFGLTAPELKKDTGVLTKNVSKKKSKDMFSDEPPFRAHGGPVKAGKPYLVGERGPELIIPKHDGMVIPNGGLMNYLARRGTGLRNHMAVQ